MEKKDIRIVFMGTSEFAVPIFDSLAENYDVKLAVCTPDMPFGRGQKLTAPAIKLAAKAKNIPIVQPEKIKNNNDFIKQLRKIKPDIIVVAAYGKILPPQIINLPEHGCLNVHPSLLPKYRGASPIQSSLLNGDKETGVSIILMDLGMDTGDIVTQEIIRIEDHDDFLSLRKKIQEKTIYLLNEIIIPYIKGEINLEIQNDDQATYCQKITDDMGKIEWFKSAKSIHNKIRALGSRIGVYTFFKGKRLQVLESDLCKNLPINDAESDISVGTVTKDNETKSICVKTGRGNLQIKKIKLEGKKETAIQDFINGHQNFIGTVLE